MTGFGRGERGIDGGRVVVEVRAVNHRHLDLKLRGVGRPGLEEALSARVRAALGRGAVTLAVRVDRAAAADDGALALDRVAPVHRQLVALAAALGAPPPSLELTLARLGAAAGGAGPSVDDEAVAGDVLAAADDALAGLRVMRAREGQALAADLRGRISALSTLVEQVASASAGAAAEAHARLLDRVRRLLADAGAAELGPDRLAAELATIADRVDVSEELTRLRSHLAQALGLVDGADRTIGRALDFLVQELGRELNTVGSKAGSAAIAHLVVSGKVELEKLREQVQNVE